MRKCEKCGTVMRADLRLKVNGYTEMYLEDLTKLK